MSEPMMAEIIIFAGTYAPKDWVFCHGQLEVITDYGAIYALVGTYYGGDGRTTFGIPDLRGRTAVGYGGGPNLTPRLIGQAGGSEWVALTPTQIPAHHHSYESSVEGDIAAQLMCYNGAANAYNPRGGSLAQQGSDCPDNSKAYARNTPDSTMNAESITVDHELTVSGTTDNTGNTDAHLNMPPWLCLNYIMSMAGYFPPRT